MPPIAPLLVFTAACAAAVLLWVVYHKATHKEEEESTSAGRKDGYRWQDDGRRAGHQYRRDEGRERSRYQSACNWHASSRNHDHEKYRHPTKESAEAERSRMQRYSDQYDDTERLNVYYNSDIGGWYVGRGSWQ